MQQTRNIALTIAACLNALFGIVLVAGGGWLISLRGSWYYALAGLAMLVTAWLLFRRRATALWVYAALVMATLLWALWEAGLDWWPLAARGDVLFLLGVFMLTPWVTRPLMRQRAPRDGDFVNEEGGNARRTGDSHKVLADHRATTPLLASLLIFLVVGVTSWFFDPHSMEGELVAKQTQTAADDLGVPPEEWHAYGRTLYGQRFSPLTQITPENVSQLEVAWHYKTGDVRGEPWEPEETTFQVTPLKIGELLYLCTPHQSVIALNATSGEEVWRYNPQIRDKLALQHLTCRGLSYYDPANAKTPAAASDANPESPRAGFAAQEEAQTRLNLPVAAKDGRTTDTCGAMLFMPTADGRIIALNPEDGAVCANFGNGTGQITLWANMPFPRVGGYYSTSAVLVTRSLIIVGGTVLDNFSTEEPAGVIRAFDARTGELVWNWDPAKPDDTAPIAADALYTHSTPNSWTTFSADEALGMVYIPMANASPDQWGGDRNEVAAQFASAIVALDIETGKLQWALQTMHHDLWDYDLPSQPSLIDLTINQETVPALVQPSKQGELYVLDRRNGKPLLPITERPAPQGAAQGDFTAPTQPVSALSFEPEPLTEASMWGATMFDQLACRIEFRSLRYEGRYTPPSTQGTLVYPGNFGVFNWGSVAVDPELQTVFATPTHLAFVSKLVPRKDDTTLYVQGDKRPQDSLPALNENFGAPFAVQLSAFTSKLGLPCQQPPWGFIAAADLTTGKVAWMRKNGTVRDSSPLPLPFKMGVPNLGGPLMTAGRVAFLSSTLDYYMRGYDVMTGTELWKARLPAGGQATPMTYVGADGRQYVVVAAGGHGSLGTKAGDDVIAYALPDGARK